MFPAKLGCAGDAVKSAGLRKPANTNAPTGGCQRIMAKARRYRSHSLRGPSKGWKVQSEARKLR